MDMRDHYETVVYVMIFSLHKFELKFVFDSIISITVWCVVHSQRLKIEL